MISKKYSVLLADCPWHYKVWNELTGAGRSPSAHYPTMNLKTLKALNVPAITADNCVIFFWVVDWMKPSKCESVLEAWGFTYRTRAWTWFKTSKDGEKFIMGKGWYTRANPEDCWIGVKGKGSMPVTDKGVPSWIIAPRTYHSAKPDEQYEKIERLYPESIWPNRLELFARSHWSGWDVWGNEVESTIELNFDNV